MLWKIVILFLCAMMLLAMVGKWLFPNSRLAKRGKAKVAKCPRCGRPQIGQRGCDCTRGRG